MSINYSVYGSENEWLTTYMNNVLIPPYKNFKQGIINGYLSLNSQIDDSISTVQCDSGATFLNHGFVNSGINKRIDNILRINENDLTKIGYCLSTSDYRTSFFTNSTSAQQYIYADIFNVNQTTWQYSSVQPVVSVGKNDNLRGIIRIGKNNDKYTSTKMYTLQEFIDDFEENDIVSSISLDIYCKNTDGIYSKVNKDGYNYSFIDYLTFKKNSEKLYFEFSESILNFSNVMYMPKFHWTGSNTPHDGKFEIFANHVTSNSDYGFTRLTNNTTHYVSYVGFCPNIENMEIGEKRTEKGVTVEKITNVTYTRYINPLDEYYGGSLESFVEWVKKQCAYFGIFFVTDENNLQLSNNSEGVFLGIVESGGVTRGNYSEGIENEKQLNYDENLTDIPKETKENNDKGDIISKTNSFLITSANRNYVLNDISFTDLMKFINTGYLPNTEDLTKDFKGKNPIDYIVSVNVYPFDIKDNFNFETDLYLGNIAVTKAPFVSGEKVKVKSLYNQLKIYDFGAILIDRYFNNFLDYEPFTKAEIQLPFCGVYNIDLRKFYNKNLSVKYCVDFCTGAVTAYIFMNDLIIDSVNGQIGYSLPLSGIAQGDFQNTMQRNSFNEKAARLGVIKSAVNNFTNAFSGNFSGLANSTINSIQSLENYFQSNYEKTHYNLPPTELSSADSLNGFYQDLQPRIIFYRCRDLPYDKDIYSNTVGYACLKNGKLGTFNGLVICSNAKLENISATETEKTMLKNLLLSGIYN